MYFTFFGFSYAKENYYNEAKKKFDNNDLESSKFLFQKNIVFNPKHANSYLYLAKIYKEEKNDELQEQNLDTVILLNPKNEEALFLMILLKIKKSDFKESEKLIKNFEKVCKNLCDKEQSLVKKLNVLKKTNQ